MDCNRQPCGTFSKFDCGIGNDWYYMDIILAVRGDYFPKIDHPVVEFHKLSKQRFVDTEIGVPGLVLTSWNGMQIQHDVKILCCATLDDSIQDKESFWYVDSRV